MKTNFTLLFALLIFITISEAKENVNQAVHHQNQPAVVSCMPSTSTVDLDIGNVRAAILMNGDMWWDLIGSARYEVPKNSGKHALYAGAIWLGGKDAGGNLKVAAQTYRQGGSDFWPGPVDTTNATVSTSTCTQYDRHWRVTRAEVYSFDSSWAPGNIPVTPSITTQQWPGNGDVSLGQAHLLAPFHDRNGDGEYHWQDGDYPGYNLNSDPTQPDPLNVNGEYLLGDQTIWWVFNDEGNIHAESGGAAFGVEIQAQAFAFSSVINSINNTTFYKYKIINRSSLGVDSTYFGQWIDPDLGNPLDDYVGCDVARGMGYCYNGDAFDDGPDGYGYNPPAVGVDFLQGPAADIGDGVDNDRDSCIDCTWLTDQFGNRYSVSDSVLPERIKMSKFVYYNNDGSSIGNPSSAGDYYYYLKGIWRDGTPIRYGGNGHGTGNGSSQTPADFMFPGISDPTGWGTNHVTQVPWDENTAGNSPDDRRFMQSAGPFTFLPGQVQYVTTAVIWSRASNGPIDSVDSLLQADDEIQNFFNSSFKLSPLSINTIADVSNSIKVFPNPFNDFTEIDLSGIAKNKSSVDVDIFDMHGQMVQSYRKITSDRIIIKQNGMYAGTYLYRISMHGNEIKTGKLIVMN